VQTLAATMMKPKKDKINLFYAVLGLCFCLAFLWPSGKEISEDELVTKSVVVKSLQKILYYKSGHKYTFDSYEYECSFAITAGGVLAGTTSELDRISKNDTLLVKITSGRLSDLHTKLEYIPVYSIQKNGKSIFTVDSYNKAQTTYDKRWSTIYLVMGILFLLRGFTLISSKAAYISGAFSLIIILTVRLLNIW
jgi:hypothetical protein